MEKHSPPKKHLPRFGSNDHKFMAIITVLIFVKVTVDAFNMYGKDISDGVGQMWWLPFVEQYTSFVFIAVAVPFIVWAVNIHPFNTKPWLKSVAYHFLFTVIFFVVHVTGFIALRKTVFFLLGEHYVYGGWPNSALLEYPLDMATYLIVAVSYFVMTKLPGVTPEKEQAVELNCGSRSIWVKPNEIIYVQAAGNYVDVVLAGKTHLVRSTLEDLQTLINGNDGNLRRIHRSTLVNPGHISERAPSKNGSRKLTISNGDEVIMSRRYSDALN